MTKQLNQTRNMVTRALLRRLPLRRNALHTHTARFTSSLSPASPVVADFAQWLTENARPDTTTKHQAVVDFLGLTNVDQAALTPTRRQEIVAANNLIPKIGSVATWLFQTHGDAVNSPNSSSASELSEVEAVWKELSPWGNAAKSDVWQHFYMRKFFLSKAPLKTFVACYKIHCKALEANKERYLDLPSALLAREFCWRGRFDEAVDAYVQLKLTDTQRRSFTAVLYEFEQYEALRRVYAIQDERDKAKGRDKALLDARFILQALHNLGLRDELLERFETLPQEEQSRPEIQEILSEL